MSKTTIETVEESALAVATSFMLDHPLDSKKKDATVTAIEVTAIDPITSENITPTIESLHKLADMRLGVERYNLESTIPILGATGAGETVLVRDARSQDTKGREGIDRFDQTPECYMLSACATARGAMKLIDLADKLTDAEKGARKTTLLASLNSQIGSLRDKPAPVSPADSIKSTRAFEEIMIGSLNGLSVGGKTLQKRIDITSALSDARDMCNLEDKQPHIATIYKGPNKDVAITTVAARAAPFSDQQKKEFAAIRTHAGDYKKYTLRDRLAGRKRSESDQKLPKWYKDLKPHQQKLVLTNIDTLCEGTKTVATSLRFLPGLRNAYAEMDFRTKSSAPSAQVTTQYNRTFRTATPSYFKGKGATRDEVSEENLRHAVSLGGKKEVGFQIYNSRGAGEGPIISLAKKAAASIKINFSNVGMQTKVKKSAMYERMAAEQVDRTTTQEQMNPLAGQGTQEPGWKKCWQIISCKSGKDRTDMAARERNAETYSRVELKASFFAGDIIAENRAKSGHGETIAGSYGGNHGSLGLKTGAMYKFLSVVKVKDVGARAEQARPYAENKAGSLNAFDTSIAGKFRRAFTRSPKKAATAARAAAGTGSTMVR